MPETQDWAAQIDAIISESIAQQNVGTLRSRILELVQHAYSQGIGASAELAHKRMLVTTLVPACAPPGEMPGVAAIEQAQKIVGRIYATVK